MMTLQDLVSDDDSHNAKSHITEPEISMNQLRSQKSESEQMAISNNTRLENLSTMNTMNFKEISTEIVKDAICDNAIYINESLSFLAIGGRKTFSLYLYKLGHTLTLQHELKIFDSEPTDFQFYGRSF